MDESKHGLIVDLNKYRSGRDLKAYMDAGADGFILRIGGPTQWVEGDYRYQEDATWRPYMEQADKLGITDKIGGYIIHNPFEEWRTDYNVHVDLLNQWTSGGYMPGYFILDHEINYTWRGNTKIIVTPDNLVNSLASVTDKIYKKWRKMCGIYTGRWFIDQNGATQHITYLDNINKPESAGGAGKQRPMWYAYYLNQYFDTEIYTNLRDVITAVPTPSGDSFGKYLQCGSYSGADLWQVTSLMKFSGDSSSTGVDTNITWGTLEEYWEAVGVNAQTEPPTEPPVEPPPDAAQLDRIEAALARIEAKLAEPQTWSGTWTSGTWTTGG